MTSQVLVYFGAESSNRFKRLAGPFAHPEPQPGGKVKASPGARLKMPACAQPGRDPSMMMAMPTRLTETPTTSVVVGRMPSTAQSQRMATPT